MKKYVLLLAILLMAAADLNAQNRRQPVVFSILAGAPLPAGSFGSTDGGNSGFANIGAGGTFEFAALIYSPGIAWITSTTYLYNPVKEDEIKNYIVGASMEGFSAGSWNNINLLTGLKVYGPFFGSQLIFTFGAGVNFAGPPKFDLPDNITNISFEYGKRTSFAYALGAGFNFSGFLIGARYMGLGEPELKVKTSAGEIAVSSSYKMPAAVTYLYIGFNL
ncbi:MAG TPA: hypothetical protein VHO28_15165 [Ignavibacteriales bacterium]|nr:hypothetical protein [Ignavibacteriales bacterium]